MTIGLDFPTLLVFVTLLTGLITLGDVCKGSKRRAQEKRDNGYVFKQPWYVEYSRSFFPVLLIVLVVRSFIFQPYRVPTGSLEPTVLPGDIIAVNQAAYGLRLPLLNTKIFPIGVPKVGDIAVFRWPPNPHINFVKRVVGVPGDIVSYKNKILYINGKEASQTLVKPAMDKEAGQAGILVLEKTEDLNGVKHNIFVWPQGGLNQDFSVRVPKGSYFMMGDNRDNSDDSRSWGFVPEENLVGRAYTILVSWDSQAKEIRWSRTGQGFSEKQS